MYSFFDLFITEVSLFWIASLVLDLFLSLKRGQFWWKIEGPLGKIHKILHIVIGFSFVLGGLFVFYFYRKPLVFIILCFFYIFHAVVSHFLITFQKIQNRWLLEISDFLCLLASAVLALVSTVIMGYKPFVNASIIIILLAFIFFILNLIKSRKIYFILEKLFCTLLIFIFTFWFLL